MDGEQFQSLLSQQRLRVPGHGRHHRDLRVPRSIRIRALHIPFKQTIFYIFLASLAVPNLLLLIPQFLLMDRLHLLNSLAGLTLLYVRPICLLRFFSFAVFSRRYRVSTKSRSDWTGPARFVCWCNLIAATVVARLAVVSMFIFSAAWDEFPIALTMISSSNNYTLPVGLADFIGVHTVAWGPFFAASVIATVPVIVVFLISLRWFRSGVSLGAIR